MVIDRPSVNFILNLADKAESDIEKFNLSLKILEAYFEFSEPLEDVNRIEQLIEFGKTYYLKQKEQEVAILIQLLLVDAVLKLEQWNLKQADKNIKLIEPLLEITDAKIYSAYCFYLKGRQKYYKQVHNESVVYNEKSLNILKNIPGGTLKHKNLYVHLNNQLFASYIILNEFEKGFPFYFEAIRFGIKNKAYHSLVYILNNGAIFFVIAKAVTYFEEAKSMALDIVKKHKTDTSKVCLANIEFQEIRLKSNGNLVLNIKLLEQALHKHKNTMLNAPGKYFKGVYLTNKIIISIYKNKKEDVLLHCNQLNNHLKNCESPFYYDLFSGLTKLCILDEQYLKIISKMPEYNKYSINYSIDNLFELLIKFTKTRKNFNRIKVYNLIIDYYKNKPPTKLNFKIFTECITELQKICTDTSKFKMANLTTQQFAKEEIKKKDSLLASQKKLIKFFKEFSYTAAHDLKAPIQTITGYSKIIKEAYNKMSREEAQDYLDKIINTGSTMTGFIDELINFSRYSKINQQDLVAIDLRKIVNQVKTNLSNEIEQSCCKINILFEHGSVLARKSPVEMLFQNLMSNAIKYRRHDVPLIIEISYNNESNVIAIKDNGVGISDDMHKKIFKPFFRIPNENVISTGIGLATCKRIIESFGGKIWLESEVGEGSTFYFTLHKRESC